MHNLKPKRKARCGKHNEEKLCLKPWNFSFFSTRRLPHFFCFIADFFLVAKRRGKKNNFQLILKSCDVARWSEFVYFLFPLFRPALCLNKHLQMMLYIFLFALMYNERTKNLYKNFARRCVGKFMLYIAEARTPSQTVFSSSPFPFAVRICKRRRSFPLNIFARSDGMLALSLSTARVRCRSATAMIDAVVRLLNC